MLILAGGLHGFCSIFNIQEITADDLKRMNGRNGDNVSKKGVRVGKEMNVRIEREAILTLQWHHNDQSPVTHSTQLRDRRPNVKNVFENVGANDGVELAIRERQLLNGRRDELHRRVP